MLANELDSVDVVEGSDGVIPGLDHLVHIVWVGFVGPAVGVEPQLGGGVEGGGEGGGGVDGEHVVADVLVLNLGEGSLAGVRVGTFLEGDSGLCGQENQINTLSSLSV